ncbi:hypothetical protein P7L87_25030, partial [Vibrio parahaemolyticus]|nr:hypothetical protein [Vibrio parahaemolyticus]
SDMWEAGCDPFENGYDPKNVERLYRERITDLMAECEGWRQRHVRSAGQAADLATEVAWLRKETTRLSEEWSKTKRALEESHKIIRAYEDARRDWGNQQNLESIARLLWHRFAPAHHIAWEDEPKKAEYRLAAADALAVVTGQIELPRVRDGSPAGGKTGTGLIEDDSAVAKPDALQVSRNRRVGGGYE